MKILGIESSCDECSAAVVENGETIISNVVATQIEFHRPFDGVVPEIASRKHLEWITGVVQEALAAAGTEKNDIQGIAVTGRPGLVGSLLVGLSFAKALAFAWELDFVAVDHIRAHLYAPHLENDIEYPYLGVIVSGGHTIICRVETFDNITVMGTTIDDACGEAFDKVSKFFGWGYPGGPVVDKLAQKGDPRAFNFPTPSLHKGDHTYDVSYSGLKTAVINQLDQFWNRDYEKSPENIAAAFQKRAVAILAAKVKKAVKATGLKKIVAGGGVAANSELRRTLKEIEDTEVVFPSMKLCTDNGAMIAGLGYQYLKKGLASGMEENAFSRVDGFKKKYP